jgi:hypothetical protein
MIAVVARMFRAGRPLRLRSRGLRVTHTLLFIAALAVSPGVCDACARGCRDASGQCASGAPPITGVACAVAASRGCGSCCTEHDEPPVAVIPQGSRLATAADAADGIFRMGMCSGEGQGCDCLLEPRDNTSAVPVEADHGEHGPADTIAGVILPTAAELASATSLRIPLVKPPERPVRVLYGVWRN